MDLFFVNKFDWQSSAPMGTVSTMFTYALAKQSVNTTLIIKGDPNLDYNTILKQHFGLQPLNNYKVQLQTKSFKFIRTSFVFYVKAFLYILKRANKNTIVVSRNHLFLPYLYLLKLCTNCKTVFEAHGYHGKNKRWLSRYKMMEKLFIPKLSGLCCLTDALKMLYKQYKLSLPVITLPLGSSIPNIYSIEPLSAFKQRKICYIGRYNSNIDSKTILKALTMCQDLQVNLLWIGISDKQQKEQLLREAQNEGCLNQITIYPWTGHAQMCALIKEHASAGIVSYIDSYDSNVQISPTKLFDLLAFGLPVIVSDVGATREILPHSFENSFFKPGNHNELADNIRQLFSDIGQYTSRSQLSSELSKSFTWDKRAENFMKFANDL